MNFKYRKRTANQPPMEKEHSDVEGGIRGRFGTMLVNCTSTLKGMIPVFIWFHTQGALINKLESLRQ